MSLVPPSSAFQFVTRRHFTCFGLFAIVLAVTRIAGAETLSTVPYRLNWTRDASAEGCISQERLTRVVSLLVGREPAQSGKPAVVIEGRAKSADPPERFRIELRVLASNGEQLGTRVLSTAKEHCSAVNSSLLLVLALAINPDSVNDGLPVPVTEELMRNDDDVSSPSAAGPKGETPRQILRAVPSVPGAVRLERLRFDARSKRGWSLRADLGLSVGQLPKPSPGIQVGVRRKLSDVYAMSLSGALWLPREAPGSNTWTSTVSVKIGATYMRALFCRNSGESSPLQLGACGGGQFGFRWFSPDGFARQHRSTRLLFGPVLGVYSSARVSTALTLGASVNLALQLPRDRFSYEDPLGTRVALFEPTPIACDTFLGAELAF